MAKNKKITVEGAHITVLQSDNKDYISLTNMAKPLRSIEAVGSEIVA